MAGDWLKIEAATPDKPEVFEIAMRCKVTPPDAFGRLFLVWRWFDQHTEKGNAANVTAAYLDHIAGVPGFAEAMRAVGWIEGGENGQMGLRLPNFARHNGKTAKTRALTAKRVQAHKQRSRNDALTKPTLPREEKRREQQHPVDAAFESFWKAYPKKVAKPAAMRAWKKLAPGPAMVEKIVAALTLAKAADQWTKDDGQFIPHPATWLNGERFNDELPLIGAAPAAARPAMRQMGNCGCGAPATVLIGNQPRCQQHVRGFQKVANA